MEAESGAEGSISVTMSPPVVGAIDAEVASCVGVSKVVRLAGNYAADGVLHDAEAARALRFDGNGSFRAVLRAETKAERRWRAGETSERLQPRW